MGILKILNTDDGLAKRKEELDKSQQYQYESSLNLLQKTVVDDPPNDKTRNEMMKEFELKKKQIYSFPDSNNYSSSPEKVMKMMGMAGIKQKELV